MPYKSDAQRRKFHAMLGQGEISKAVVAEYDRASKGKKLPERIGAKKPVKPAKTVPFQSALAPSRMN